VPGLGEQVVAGVIAWAPGLGRISNGAASALIGAAPYDDDSGERKGVRHIKGGRRKLRNLLYMPVMGAATQHNPVLKAYYQRLRARGKEAKVALIACMRKLIVILNTMLARDQTWNPPVRAAARAGLHAAAGRRIAPTACRPKSPVRGRGQGRSRRRRGREAPALSPAEHRATQNFTVASPRARDASPRGLPHAAVVVVSQRKQRGGAVPDI
jgi:Transposase IS116/IS110/IS902 family